MSRTAALLANMGGPETLDQVEPYLRAIFNDPAIMPLPTWLRPSMAEWISRRRSAKVKRRYWSIGGASPLPYWTRAQTQLVAQQLAGSEPELLVSFGFRYSPPTIDDRLTSLAAQGVDRVLLLPLFPHRTEAMTGSIEAVARRGASRVGCTVHSLNAWAARADVLELWTRKLERALKAAGPGARVLFVAHGIPQRNVRRGDHYPDQVAQTASTLGDAVRPGSWSLAYQSRVGPVRWTEPYLEDELLRLSASPQPLVVMALSFVADCLETIYDLDVVATQQLQQLGISRVVRVSAFNDDPGFGRIMARMLSEKLNELRK